MENGWMDMFTVGWIDYEISYTTGVILSVSNSNNVKLVTFKFLKNYLTF